MSAASDILKRELASAQSALKKVREETHAVRRDGDRAAAQVRDAERLVTDLAKAIDDLDASEKARSKAAPIEAS